eukprot:jgi/Astpho2/4456/Aster-00066
MAPSGQTWVVTGASRGLGLEHAAADVIAKQFSDGIDGLLNNAGIQEDVNIKPKEMDPAECLKVLDVNVVGPLRVTQKLLPLLLKRDTRKVVNISSLLGSISTHKKQAHPMSSKYVAYNASKAALNMQTVVLANSLREDQVTIVALHPGWVETDLGTSNGQLKPPLNTHTSVAGQQRVIAGLKLEDSGRFVGFADGKDLPY